MSNNNATVKKEEKKPLSIELVEPIEFKSNMGCMIKNTGEVAKIVDCLFGPVMRDYIGCKVALNNGQLVGPLSSEVPLGRLFVSLFFKDRSKTNDKDLIPNVALRGAHDDKTEDGKKKRNILGTLNRMSGSNVGRMYDVLNETYELLDKYRFYPNRKVQWSTMTTEIVSDYGYPGTYNQEIVVQISGLDLNRILCDIFGGKTAEGNFQYDSSVINYIRYSNADLLVQITRLDVDTLGEINHSLGGPVERVEFHQYAGR